MPERTYMVVDRRHDHSFRVPRPDLSVKFGTPNACTNCHTNRDASWAASQVNAWYGPSRAPSRFERYVAAFAAADRGASDAQDRLLAVAGDRSQPSLARATALSELQLEGTPTPPSEVSDGLNDPNPMVRLGALQSLSGLLPYMRLPLAGPLLTDPTRAVRIEAARLLATAPIGLLTRERRGAFERASGEYAAAQGFNGDRAEARVNLAMFYAERGDARAAEQQIRVAILLDPLYLPAYVNLADVYRSEGRDSDGERALNDGIALAPKSGLLHYALGLTLVRQRRVDDALAALERATRLEPDNARFAYAYAVALHSTGKVSEAIASLGRARASHPNDSDIRNALSAFQQGRTEIAPKP
jgi:Tfp pilus assembly protein PilF